MPYLKPSNKGGTHVDEEAYKDSSKFILQLIHSSDSRHSSNLTFRPLRKIGTGKEGSGIELNHSLKLGSVFEWVNLWIELDLEHHYHLKTGCNIAIQLNPALEPS